MSKIQLTFQDENIINSIDLDHNLLPLSSTKRIGNLKNNVFYGLTWLPFFPASFPFFPSSSSHPHLLPPPFPLLAFFLRELFPQLHGGSLTRGDPRSLVRPLTAPQCQAPHLWGCRIIDSSVLACHSAPLQNSWKHLCDPCHTT